MTCVLSSDIGYGIAVDQINATPKAIDFAIAGVALPDVSFDDIVRTRAALHGVPALATSVGSSSPEEWEAEQLKLQKQEARRTDGLQRELDALWEAFKGREGLLEASYFGVQGQTGAALTIRYRQGAGRSEARHGRPRVHVVLDLVTAGPAAELVSRIERVRVRADQLLVGSDRQHVMRVVFDRLCQVMRVVDVMLESPQRRAGGIATSPGYDYVEAEREDVKTRRAREARESRQRKLASEAQEQEWAARVGRAVAVAEAEVTQTEELCERAVRRVALMSYFVGMLIGVAVFTLLGIGLGLLLSHVDVAGFDLSRFLTTFVAGAVGAIVSVMSRMSLRQDAIDYEAGRTYLRVVGAFRPLIGAIFGVALYIGIESGLLHITVPEKQSEVFFFFAFIAFLAGFSERWAQDMLVSSRSGVLPAKPSQPA